MQMEDYMSGYLEDFINFMDATHEQYGISKADLDATNIDLQDLQHYIEFGHPDAKKMWKIYKLYRETRQKRRIAKDTLEQCSPIVEWYVSNQQVLKELRALLGQVRKVERQQANRSYAIRGHILDDITSLTHLTGRNGADKG